MTKKQRKNAARIVDLANAFGHLAFNAHGQTVERTLNLSIPCARLIDAGIVTGVIDTSDGVNDDAVADVEATCRKAIEFYGHAGSWWASEKADELGLYGSVATQDGDRYLV